MCTLTGKRSCEVEWKLDQPHCQLFADSLSRLYYTTYMHVIYWREGQGRISLIRTTHTCKSDNVCVCVAVTHVMRVCVAVTHVMCVCIRKERRNIVKATTFGLCASDITWRQDYKFTNRTAEGHTHIYTERQDWPQPPLLSVFTRQSIMVVNSGEKVAVY